MAISIGDALLKLGVDTRDLDKGMKGISNRIKKHQKAIGLGMVAAGGVILAAGALSIKTFAEMGDEVQKMALRTGFSTEALSELRHAAEISGASLSTLEKGVKRMSGTILDAQDGLETYIRAFQHIGIEVEELADLNPEQQFLKIAEAIAEVEDPTKRAAIAQDIFGRAGTELLPLFAAGKEGLADLREEAHKLGIVFDQEAANKAAELTDAMHRMKEATSGVKMAIAEQLIPVLLPLIKHIVNIIQKFSAWAKEHPTLTKFIILGTTALSFLLVALGMFLLIMPGVTAATAAFGITLSAAIWPITLIVAAIAGLIAIGILLWKNWDTIKAKAIKIWGGIKDFFVNIWQRIVSVFKEHWDKILLILFPPVGIAMLIAKHWNGIVAYFQSIWGRISTIFSGIGEAMWRPIQVAVDAILEYINAIIVGIQGLWAIVQRIFGRGGVRGGGLTGRGRAFTPSPWPDIPGRLGGGVFQEGGIAMRPMLARIAEQAPRIPEAVIPLDRLERMLGSRVVNIFVELDGRIIGRAIGQPLVDEIRLRTGVRI